MTHDAIEKRTRVLVVEDIETLRDSYVLNLELEKRYRIDSAADLAQATDAITNRTYHVALVDIMLAGEKDVANRDGVKVLERIRNLNEGTKAVVLSIQPHTQLVREILKQYSAYDYLDKGAVRADGFSLVVGTIDKAAEASPVGDVPTWQAVVQDLAAGQWEEAQFVSEALGSLQFKGGFENLSRTLIGALQHFMPLLPLKRGQRGFLFDSGAGKFRGHFWSKGQGCAIRLVLCGRQPPTADSDSRSDPRAQLLLARDKADLSVRVEQVSDAARQDFAETTPSGAAPQ